MQPPDILMIGAPLGLGGGHPGTAHGPSAARAAGIVERLREAGPDALTEDVGDAFAQSTPQGDKQAVITACCRAVREMTRSTTLAGSIPLVLGGDHSIAAGSMSGVAAARRSSGEEAPGLLWIDAHTDINTDATSPSGNMHGMSAAALLGLQVGGLSDVVGEDGTYDRERFVYVGARDMDPGERAHIEQLGITVFGTREVLDRGVESVMNEALAIASPDRLPFAVTFDIDVVDPDHAPGVDTAVPGGLSPDQAKRCLAMAGAHAPILAIDLVELNPENDVDGMTACIAVDCIDALVGSTRQYAREQTGSRG